MRVCVHICFVLHTEKTSCTQTREYPLFLSLSLTHTYTKMHTNVNPKWIRNPIKKNESAVSRTLHECSVGHSKRLLIPRSSVRFRLKPFLKVIKAIIIITRRRTNFWVFWKHSMIDHVHFMKLSVLTHNKRNSTLLSFFSPFFRIGAISCYSYTFSSSSWDFKISKLESVNMFSIKYFWFGEVEDKQIHAADTK